MGADGARKRKIAVIAALAAAVLLLALLELLVGSSGMSVRQCVFTPGRAGAQKHSLGRALKPRKKKL